MGVRICLLFYLECHINSCLPTCPLREEKPFSQRAVKNGIKEAYRDITGEVTTEDIEAEQICDEEEK